VAHRHALELIENTLERIIEEVAVLRVLYVRSNLSVKCRECGQCSVNTHASVADVGQQRLVV